MSKSADPSSLVDPLAMLKPTKLKNEDGPSPSSPARSWSRAATTAFWIGVVLLLGTIAGLAYVGVRSLTEIHELEAGQRDLVVEIDTLTNTTTGEVTALTESITDLQSIVNQTTLIVNGTALLNPGAAVTLALGYGLIYRTVPDPNINYNDIAWDYALWDDAGYWSPSQPGLLVLPATGRYAVRLNCPRCCTLATTTTVEGTVTVVYGVIEDPELHCPLTIAADDVRTVSAIDTIPTLNIYGEFELTGGNGEFIAVETVLNYSPSTPVTPQSGPPDNCFFSIRYLRAATGTPIVPLACSKRNGRAPP